MSNHDCTKCHKPIPEGEETESFGVLYHAACSPEAKRKARNARRREARRGLAAAYASVGMVRVRGSRGGTYWE